MQMDAPAWGTDAALRLSTREHDKRSHPLWLEACEGYEVLVLVAPGCCGTVAQSLRLQEPILGALQKYMGGQGTHLSIHLGSRSRKAARVREGRSTKELNKLELMRTHLKGPNCPQGQLGWESYLGLICVLIMQVKELSCNSSFIIFFLVPSVSPITT